MSAQKKEKVSGQRLVQQSLENKYFESFNFYFAKPINEIVSGSKTSHAILFRDYNFYDNRHESMRRWYTTPESVLRLNNYADFFEEIKKQYYAYITSKEAMSTLSNRLYVIHHLKHNNNKSEQSNRANSRRMSIPTNPLTQNILKNLDQPSHISIDYVDPSASESVPGNSQLSLNMNNVERISYGSDVHDIYSPKFSSRANSRDSISRLEASPIAVGRKGNSSGIDELASENTSPLLVREKIGEPYSALKYYQKMRREALSIEEVYKKNEAFKENENLKHKQNIACESTKSREKVPSRADGWKRYEFADSQVAIKTKSPMIEGNPHILGIGSEVLHSSGGYDNDEKLFSSVKDKFKSMRVTQNTQKREPAVIGGPTNAFKKKLKAEENSSQGILATAKTPSINISDLLVRSQAVAKTPMASHGPLAKQMVPKLELQNLRKLEDEDSCHSGSPQNRSTFRNKDANNKSKSGKRKVKKVKTDRGSKRSPTGLGPISRQPDYFTKKGTNSGGFPDLRRIPGSSEKVFPATARQAPNESITSYIRKLLKQKREDEDNQANHNHIENLFHRDRLAPLMTKKPDLILQTQPETNRPLIRDGLFTSSSKYLTLKKKIQSSKGGSSSKGKLAEFSTEVKDKASVRHSNTGSQKDGVLLNSAKGKQKIIIPTLNLNAESKNSLYGSIKIDGNFLRATQSNLARKLEQIHALRREGTYQKSPAVKSSRVEKPNLIDKPLLTERTAEKVAPSTDRKSPPAQLNYFSNLKKMATVFEEYSCSGWLNTERDRKKSQPKLSPEKKKLKKKKTIPKNSSAGNLVLTSMPTFSVKDFQNSAAKTSRPLLKGVKIPTALIK